MAGPQIRARLLRLFRRHASAHALTVAQIHTKKAGGIASGLFDLVRPRLKRDRAVICLAALVQELVEFGLVARLAQADHVVHEFAVLLL